MSLRTGAHAGVFLVTLLASAGCPDGAAAQQPGARPSSAPNDDDWPAYNRSYAGDRYSPLRQITTGNVTRLRPVCTFDAKERLAFETGPLVVDGTLYFTTDTNSYAIDAATCALRWKQRTSQPGTYLAANRGLAYENGRLFRGAGAKHVLALDAASGRTVWDVELAGLSPGTSVPMAPLAWHGLVFVGNAGGDSYGVTGHVYALDAKDGHTIWRFDVVPDSGSARETWRNPNPNVPPTGGAFWTTFGLDTARGTLFVPAGNPAPDFMPELRPGDNLFTNSVIGLDAKTGEMVGYIQLVKHDFHDWDVDGGPMLVTTRGGTSLVVSANKDGLLSAIDRSEARSAIAATTDLQRKNLAMAGDITRTLALRYQVPTTTRENMDLRANISGAVRFCPGTQGGTEWNGPAYLPSMNLLVVGAVDWCTSLRLARPDSAIGTKPGTPWTGAIGQGFGVLDTTSKWQGWITAIDADSGTVRWKHRTPMPQLGGVTTTAGGLVLVGELSGELVALDARTGTSLWSGRTGNAIGGGVITYAVRGRQLVAAAAGMNSPTWPVKAESARIVVFGLP
jgi:alcohol dehydrogenase (cytochrome c)